MCRTSGVASYHADLAMQTFDSNCQQRYYSGRPSCGVGVAMLAYGKELRIAKERWDTLWITDELAVYIRTS